MLLLTIIIFCVPGCGSDTGLTDRPAGVSQIQFTIASSASAQERPNITRIELLVSAPDIEDPTPVPISNIDVEGRVAEDVISVPVGVDRTFSATAFDGECPVLKGESAGVEVAAENAIPVEIELRDIQIIVGIRSEADGFSVGDPVTISVYVADAPQLFGFTCELAFDPNVLVLQDVDAGDFFGNEAETLSLNDSQFPQRAPNRLTLGLTRRRGFPPVCNAGIVFQITFAARAVGETEVTLLRNDNLMLTTPSFQRIPDAQIRLEPTVSVRIE